MADDDVFDQDAQLWRKIRKRTELVGHDAQTDHHVAEQLSFGSVSESAIVTQLPDLAQVVQHATRNHQVAIDEWV